MLLKCSAHLSKIESLSVRIVLQSALTCGVVTVNCFELIMKLLYVLFIYKRLDFFCFLAQPGVLHVREPVIYCLTNVVASLIPS